MQDASGGGSKPRDVDPNKLAQARQRAENLIAIRSNGMGMATDHSVTAPSIIDQMIRHGQAQAVQLHNQQRDFFEIADAYRLVCNQRTADADKINSQIATIGTLHGLFIGLAWHYQQLRNHALAQENVQTDRDDLANHFPEAKTFIGMLPAGFEGYALEDIEPDISKVRNESIGRQLAS